VTRPPAGSGGSGEADRVDDDAYRERLRRIESRLDRERRARHEAERLLETKSQELYEANLALSALAVDLEQRVVERTRELSIERERALQMAEIDALTGIANRTSFARQLSALLTDSRAVTEVVAALLIDLDDFKTVNDTLGHAAGDSLLIEVARRLVGAVRPGDIVARLGGDEFAVIARSVGNREGCLLMAHRLLRALCQPATIEGRVLPCSCSIGVAESAGTGGDPDGLLRDADLALYASKRAGRGRVTSFDTALRSDVERRAALDAEVRNAVFAGQIEPWYQPIRRTGDAAYFGAEVLARWHVPDGQVRSPADFLRTVEDLGLLDSMMENMLRRAFREALPMAADGSLEYLAINVSPVQFNQDWAQSCLPGLLEETGFPAHALVVEITETALLLDIDRTRTKISALKDRGIKIALDDFGIGYSNFSMLRQLPFDLLKLDRTLVCDIETDERAHALAEGILNLAARLHIKCVAEGVETPGQAALLESAGCPAMQGYWFSRPKRDLRTWFAEENRAPRNASLARAL